ncbi:hypothetical protein [Williamsia soli]|uniref:hypothetical protein n=1 Tax=Williamsia soli TaxID=364929 RepID=UPI001A9CF048|nr:hypothetical protein [Williamsia soli]
MSARREDRDDEAFERLEKRYERTPEQQLAELDRRLGRGIGAKRERARLWAELTPTKRKRVSA